MENVKKDDCKDMRTEVKAVVGTNAWGDALYGKMLRGSYVEEDVIREAVQTAIDEEFDAVICSNSFHHYPNPQKFFDSVQRVLRPGGRLILQDYTAPRPILWLMNHTEMPLANLIGHGDVGAYSLDEVRGFCRQSGLQVEKLESGKKFRLHLVARKKEKR